MDTRIFGFHGNDCKISEGTAQASGGVTIPASAQRCVDMDDGECGGGAGLVFGLDHLKGLFEF